MAFAATAWLGGGKLRVEQDSRPQVRKRHGDFELEAAQVIVGDYEWVGWVEDTPQVLAMVEGQAGERPARGGALL
jgi:truncated hemoglobin YjbI